MHIESRFIFACRVARAESDEQWLVIHGLNLFDFDVQKSIGNDDRHDDVFVVFADLIVVFPRTFHQVSRQAPFEAEFGADFAVIDAEVFAFSHDYGHVLLFLEVLNLFIFIGKAELHGQSTDIVQQSGNANFSKQHCISGFAFGEFYRQMGNGLRMFKAFFLIGEVAGREVLKDQLNQNLLEAVETKVGECLTDVFDLVAAHEKGGIGSLQNPGDQQRFMGDCFFELGEGDVGFVHHAKQAQRRAFEWCDVSEFLGDFFENDRAFQSADSVFRRVEGLNEIEAEGDLVVAHENDLEVDLFRQFAQLWADVDAEIAVGGQGKDQVFKLSRQNEHCSECSVGCIYFCVDIDYFEDVETPFPN